VVQLADLVMPFDDHCQWRAPPIHHHVIGVVMLEVVHAVEVFGVIERLILNFPSALG
jgi:hypothetical protein